MATGSKKRNRYQALIEKIFVDGFRRGSTEVLFARTDLEIAARTLKVSLPKNLGDILYSFRYRTAMPARILAAQPKGREWIIEGAGRSRYAFRLVPINRILPNPVLADIKVPDATPEIISAYALTDEQALLAKVRYNRLVDIFLGIAAYSLQNHLKTTVGGIGGIEIDEVYVGVDRNGGQYIIPVQAKRGGDRLSVVQTKQDLACCAEKFPNLVSRALSAQFMADNLIAMFELTVDEDHVKIIEERHYRLVPAEEISATDLAAYRKRH
jgi:hypothetical protein